MASDSTGEGTVHPGPSKGLIWLVKALGIILVLLFLALIGGIIWKATHKAPPALVVVDVILDLGIDPASVRHMAIDGNYLALTTDQEILVIEIAKRKVTLRSRKP